MTEKAAPAGPVALERLAVEYVPITTPQPNAYNPNRQTEHEYALLLRSIAEDGFTQPIRSLLENDRTQDSVWEYPRPTASGEHPTMKPVAMIERMIRNSAHRTSLVADPFAGSGSTLIACHNTNRRGRLIEIDPAYCDVIRHRYATHVG